MEIRNLGLSRHCDIDVFFLGVGGFGGIVLESLLGLGINITGVCTDTIAENRTSFKVKMKRGIKRLLKMPDFGAIVSETFEGQRTPIEIAERSNLSVFSIAQLRTQNLLDFVTLKQPHLIITAGFPKLVPIELIDAAEIQALNFHPGLLPSRAGATPSRAAVFHGDLEAGLSVHSMNKNFDSGHVVWSKRMAIEEFDTAGQVDLKVAGLVPSALQEIMHLASSDPELLREAKVAENHKIQLTPKINASVARYDWTEDGEVISRKIRSMLPRAVVPTVVGGRRLGVWEFELDGSSGTPGEIIRLEKGCPVVATGTGGLVLRSFYDGVGIRASQGVRWRL